MYAPERDGVSARDAQGRYWAIQLVQRIEALSQERLLAAIEFALAHTATQSRLRALIEAVCTESVTAAINKGTTATH